MKKAVVVGGSSGIGLAFAIHIAGMGFHVIIIDKEPPGTPLSTADFTHFQSDLLYFDEEFFQKLASDDEICLLFISAGFGRVAPFDCIFDIEIDNLFKVNSIAIARIVRAFYHRIRNQNKFMCGVMGSFAGLVNSPLFSVYSATKAAVFRLIESINTELSVNKIENRILNISPGHLSGTKFDNENQNLDLLGNLPSEIFNHLSNRCELFIPDYEKTYKNVLIEYQKLYSTQ